MPPLKQFVGRAVVRALGHSVVVREIRELSPRLRRVRFAGDSVGSMRWSPGDKIKLRVGSVMRSYTPAAVDRERGTLDVVFHLHGDGPAARWAVSLVGGEPASFVGPARSVAGPTESVPWAAFLGDETTIGLAEAVLGALPPRTPIVGALELDREDADAGVVETVGLPLTTIVRAGEHGDALAEWLARTPLPVERDAGEGVVWISGEASAVLRLRDALRERGIERPQVRIKSYWSVRGTAHRKALERGALAS